MERRSRINTGEATQGGVWGTDRRDARVHERNEQQLNKGKANDHGSNRPNLRKDGCDATIATALV